jgi:hypothetical protein
MLYFHTLKLPLNNDKKLDNNKWINKVKKLHILPLPLNLIH